jgi:hypothetical protein
LFEPPDALSGSGPTQTGPRSEVTHSHASVGLKQSQELLISFVEYDFHNYCLRDILPALLKSYRYFTD